MKHSPFYPSRSCKWGYILDQSGVGCPSYFQKYLCELNNFQCGRIPYCMEYSANGKLVASGPRALGPNSDALSCNSWAPGVSVNKFDQYLRPLSLRIILASRISSPELSPRRCTPRLVRLLATTLPFAFTSCTRPPSSTRLLEPQMPRHRDQPAFSPSTFPIWVMLLR